MSALPPFTGLSTNCIRRCSLTKPTMLEICAGPCGGNRQGAARASKSVERPRGANLGTAGGAGRPGGGRLAHIGPRGRRGTERAGANEQPNRLVALRHLGLIYE